MPLHFNFSTTTMALDLTLYDLWPNDGPLFMEACRVTMTDLSASDYTPKIWDKVTARRFETCPETKRVSHLLRRLQIMRNEHVRPQLSHAMHVVESHLQEKRDLEKRYIKDARVAMMSFLASSAMVHNLPTFCDVDTCPVLKEYDVTRMLFNKLTSLFMKARKLRMHATIAERARNFRLITLDKGIACALLWAKSTGYNKMEMAAAVTSGEKRKRYYEAAAVEEALFEGPATEDA